MSLTFGNTNISLTRLDNGWGSAFFVCKYTAPERGRINRVSFHSGYGTPGYFTKGVILSHDAVNNRPNALLAVGSEVEGLQDAWIDSIIDYEMTAGEILWLGLYVQSNLWGRGDLGTPMQTYVFSQGAYPDVPTLYNPLNYRTYDTAASIYAEYTPTVPPETVTVQYQSTPIAAVAVINGINVDSGGQITVGYGSTITLLASTVSGYAFDHWTVNGATMSGNPLTLVASQDLTVIAVYVQQIVKHILDVDSNISGIPFTLKGVNTMSYVIPFQGELDEGTYEIEMPASVMVGVDNYNFQSWEDGAVSPKKTIQFLEDASLYATYVPGVPPKPGFNKLWLLPIGIGAVVGVSLLSGKKKRK